MNLPTIPYLTAFKTVRLFGRRLFGVKLVNCFHHDYGDRVNFGFGLLQVESRHLIFVGNDGFSLFFVPALKHW